MKIMFYKTLIKFLFLLKMVKNNYYLFIYLYLLVICQKYCKCFFKR